MDGSSAATRLIVLIYGQTTARVAGTTSSLCSLGQPLKPVSSPVDIARLLHSSSATSRRPVGPPCHGWPTGWTELGQPGGRCSRQSNPVRLLGRRTGNPLELPAVWQIGGLATPEICSSYGGVRYEHPARVQCQASRSVVGTSMNWPESLLLPAAPGDVIVAFTSSAASPGTRNGRHGHPDLVPAGHMDVGDDHVRRRAALRNCRELTETVSAIRPPRSPLRPAARTCHPVTSLAGLLCSKAQVRIQRRFWYADLWRSGVPKVTSDSSPAQLALATVWSPPAASSRNRR